MIIRSTFVLRAATLAASMALFAAANAASAHGSGGGHGGGGHPAVGGPLHGPGSSHNPIIINGGPSRDPVASQPTRDHRGPNGAPQGGVTVKPICQHCGAGGWRGPTGGGGGRGPSAAGFPDGARDHR